jgi:hypothetical protein
MKRLRPSDDLDSTSYGDKCKDPNPNLNSGSNTNRSSSHRGFYYKSPENGRIKGLLSSSASARYDRDRSAADEDREGSRMVRKRPEHEFDGDRRKGGFDRYGGGYDRNLMHRSESFCGGLSSSSAGRREFPKGFRSERSSSAAMDRSRREGSVSSWRRFGSNNSGNKDSEVKSPTARIGLRDVKSPSWSRDSATSESTRMVRSSNSGSSPIRGARVFSSSRTTREESKSKSKSPSWSRESGASEQQSRSVEVEAEAEAEVVKKVATEQEEEEEEVQNDSKSSSEMEEGELEPEPEPESKPEPETESEAIRGESGHEVEAEAESETKKVKNHVGLEIDSEKEVGVGGVKVGGNEELGKEDKEKERKIEIETEREVTKKESLCEERKEKGVDEEVQESNSDSGSDSDSDSENDLIDESHGGSGDEIGMAANDEGGGGDKEEEGAKEDGECEEEVKKNVVVDDKPLRFEEECKQQGKEGLIDLEAKAESVEVAELNEEENGGGDEVNVGIETEGLRTQDFKDKGKSVSIEPTHSAEDDGVWIRRDARDDDDDDDDMEGPSTRGFELFSTSPVRRQEKDDRSGVNNKKDEKLVLEPLDLSLSLPNVLLPIGAAPDTNQAAPGSPSQARSVQSLSNTFCTNSDGLTASMSFSGSQSFFHNPSCSMTQNSLDNFEQSVGSRPIFQGIDWQGLSQNESKQKEIPLYHRILMNGNGTHSQSQVLQGSSNGQAVQGQHHRVLEGSSKMGNGLERQLSFHRQLSGGQARHHDDVRSPSQSVGSHDIGSNYSFDKKRGLREKSNGSLYRTSSQKELEQLPMGGVEFVETVIARIVAEPVHVMARRLHEMPGQSIACLKESIHQIMLNVDKRPQLLAFQKALQNKSDITMEMLLKSHRAQLEILVALKTGLPDYLQLDISVSPSHLAEVFLNLKCRNLTCKQSLPVDECDCKVCGQKNGFCSACMCLVCSKFDMASNTCSWVGCDVCLHWCHADCALRESFIRNGRSATSAYGATEMQFHCVACDHPSEMFGFVKEVFQNFAKDWTAETLSRELEYVKRIFRDSKDMRGRRLHEIADQMLARLANKSDLHEVYSYIMAFLNGKFFLFDIKELHCFPPWIIMRSILLLNLSCT